MTANDELENEDGVQPIDDDALAMATGGIVTGLDHGGYDRSTVNSNIYFESTISQNVVMDGW